MAPVLTLAEVYSDLRCNAGAALGAIQDATIVRTRALPNAGSNELVAELPRSSLAWTHLRERRVVSLTFSDGSFEEWRISALTEEARRDAGLVSALTAHWPEIDLATAGTLSRTEADGTTVYRFEAFGLTLTQHLAIITSWLTGQGVTYFAAGTLEAVGPIDFIYDRMTPLAACLGLAAQVSGSTGRKLEFQVRRNGTTNYLLDFLTQIGASAPRLYVQFGKNQVGVKRQRSSVEQATQAVGLGTPGPQGPSTIAEALWKVASAPTGTTARLVDPAGGDGPLLEDDQLNGLYARKWPSGAWILVTDSALLNHEITLTSAHGWVATDLIQFGTSGSGAELRSLKSPANQALYGLIERPLERPDLPGHINVIPNPSMRDYTTGSNAPPDGWAIIPGCGLAAANVDKETTANRYRVGGASARVVTSGDGQGIESPYGTIAPSDRRPYGSGFMGFWNDTDGGEVRVDMVAGKATVTISSLTRSTAGGITTVTVNTGSAHGLAVGDRAEVLGVTGGTTPDGYNGIHVATRIVDADSYEFELPSDPGSVSLSSATNRQVFLFPDGVNDVASSLKSKVWDDLGWQNESLKALGAVVVKMRVMQHRTTGLTLYVDRAQVTLGAGEGQQAYVEGSGGTQLWQALNRYLAEFGPPAVRYDVDLLDLGRLDAARWPYDDLTLGGPIDVDDQRWALDVSTRILQIRQVLRDPQGDAAVAAVVLSNRSGDLTDETVRPDRSNRTTGGTGLEAAPQPEAYFSFGSSVPTQVLVRLSSTPRGARLYYWIGDAVQGTPPIGTVVAGAPTASAWGTYTGPFTVNRVQSKDLALWVYAVAGGRTSPARPWTIDYDTTPTVSLQLTQPSGSSVRVSWSPDVDVARARVYARRVASPGAVAWPTSDGTQAAQVSETYFRRELSVTTAGGGFDELGATLAGGLEYTDGTSPWGNGDKWAVIVVPIDRFGNVGTRAEASLTFAGTPPGSISSFSAVRDDDGTACDTDGAQFTINWTTANASDGGHDLKLYYRFSVGGGTPTAWALITTITTPVSTLSHVYTSIHMKTAGKFDPTVAYEFKGELVDTVPTVLDTRQSATLSFTSSCEL